MFNFSFFKKSIVSFVFCLLFLFAITGVVNAENDPVSGTIYASAETVPVGEEIKVVITGQDEQGLSNVILTHENQLLTKDCEGSSSCQKEFTFIKNEAGSYEFYGYVTGYDENGETEQNSTSPIYVTVEVTEGYPDLAVSSLNSYSDGADFSVKNLGEVQSPDFLTSLKVGKISASCKDDLDQCGQIDYQEICSFLQGEKLPAGEQTGNGCSYSSDLESGSYYVAKLTADAGENVKESNEQNNQKLETFKDWEENDQPSGAISVSTTSVEVGEEFTISVRGQDDQGMVAVHPEYEDELIGETTRNCNHDQNCEKSWTLSKSDPGSYTYLGYVFGLKLDGLAEKSPTEPKSVTVKVEEPETDTSPESGSPDLVVQSIKTIPTSKEITVLIKNTGSSTTESFYVETTVGENYEDKRSFQGIDTGEKIKFSPNFSGITGVQEIKVSVDPGDRIEELDESNNTDFVERDFGGDYKNNEGPLIRYPQDGDTIYGISPSVLLMNLGDANYYQLGFWKGEKDSPEQEPFTWSYTASGSRDIYQGGPLGKFDWGNTYTIALRGCENEEFDSENCGEWKETTSFKIEPTSSYKETDQGKDFDAKGQISSEKDFFNIMADKCLHDVRKESTNKKTLIEYYKIDDSDEPVQQVLHECEMGCRDGACWNGVTVLAPDAYEWKRGETHEVKWEAHESVDRVDLKIQGYSAEKVLRFSDYLKGKDGIPAKGIDAQKGSYTWEIPLSEEGLSRYPLYKLLVVNSDEGKVYDKTDSHFNISCYDTDNGHNPYQAGKVFSGPNISYDNCYGDTLNESVCVDGELETYENHCYYGCKNRKCIQKSKDSKLDINIWAQKEKDEKYGEVIAFYSDYPNRDAACKQMVITPDGTMVSADRASCADYDDGFSSISVNRLKEDAKRFGATAKGEWEYRIYLPEYDVQTKTKFILSGDVKQPSTPASNLFRPRNSHKVYEIIDGKRHWVRNLEEFNKKGYRSEDVKIVPLSELNKYSPLRLIRQKGKKKIYIVGEKNNKRHIPNPDIFYSYGFRPEEITEVKKTTIEAIPETKLIRWKDGTKVYRIENGKKRWVTSIEAFINNGYDWGQVAKVNKTEIEAYPKGEPIE